MSRKARLITGFGMVAVLVFTLLVVGFGLVNALLFFGLLMYVVVAAILIGESL